VAFLRSKRGWLLALGVLLLLAGLCYRSWLPLPALFLVAAEDPTRADAILVLGGDVNGYRTQMAAELVGQGYAPVAIVSGNNWYYGLWECEVAIDYAVRNGQPREVFEPFRVTATSTDEEVQQIYAEAQRRNLGSMLVVTSNFHTRRTGILFRRHQPEGIDVRIVAAPDRYFLPQQWWWHRESRKTLFYEWVKLGAVMVGGL
jgi:uncharacterized SAM-binding protein YcdF (DUF218 family)